MTAEALLAAADRAGIGTVVTIRRPDGRYQNAFVNEAALALNGYERSEFMSMHPFSFLAPGEAERLSGPSLEPSRARAEGGVSRVETTIVHKSGEHVPIEVVLARVPWPDASGGHAIVSYFSDLRERRRAESAFRDHVSRVDRLVALGTLAAGVAHEVNNPIAVTAASLEALDRLIEHGSDSVDFRERARALLADARGGADRVTRIVRDLRGLSRSDDERGPVDLSEVFASAERMVAGIAHERARIVRREGPLPLVWGDAGRLEQVFVNLLLNAVQAMPSERPERGTIRIDVEQIDGVVSISVRDDGVGIAPEHLPRIFDPFFTTKRAGEGTGLGLAICHTIVTQLGGTISVESERGKGTVFLVQLQPSSIYNARRATEAPVSGKTCKRAKILVVDDEPTLVRTLVTLLGEDHDVVGATSGTDALGILLSNAQFDVVLCDLMMPYLTGMDLYERLARERPGLEDRLVFMTGGAFTVRARQFLRRVPNKRFDKPFSPAQVTELVQAALRDASPSALRSSL